MDIDTYDGTIVVKAIAEELKHIPECKAPAWSHFVKTGLSRTRPPVNLDWWHDRVASVLRKVTILGPIGVNKLRRMYGGKQRRGYDPPKFVKGSGKIVRVALQQLEKAGLIKQTVVDGHKGRVLDVKGKDLLVKVQKKIRGANGPQ